MTQPTPTERKLTKSDVELIAHFVHAAMDELPDRRGGLYGQVERLAASWLEQNAALEQIATGEMGEAAVGLARDTLLGDKLP